MAMMTSGVHEARGYWYQLIDRSAMRDSGVVCNAQGIADALGCDIENVAYLALLDQPRDADTVTESNFMVAVDMLNAADPTGDAFTVQRWSHSLCGYIDHVFVDTRNEAVCAVVNDIADALASYPVLNEHHWCEHEWNVLHRDGECHAATIECECGLPAA